MERYGTQLPYQDFMEQLADKPHRRIHWQAILKTQEGVIFLLGLGCLLAILVWMLACADTDAGKAAMFLVVVPAHVTGGRASGVAIALGSGQFSPLEAMALASLIEGMVVCLFFSAFCLSMKKLVHLPRLHNAMRDVHQSAQNQRHLIAKWGIVGLLLFVWFPFMMTGPVVGAIIGYLLGLRHWVTLGTVLAGTVSAIICWTYLMDQMTELMRSAGSIAPIVGVAVIVITLIVIRLRSYRQGQSHGAAASGGPETPAGPG